MKCILLGTGILILGIAALVSVCVGLGYLFSLFGISSALEEDGFIGGFWDRFEDGIILILILGILFGIVMIAHEIGCAII